MSGKLSFLHWKSQGILLRVHVHPVRSGLKPSADSEFRFHLRHSSKIAEVRVSYRTLCIVVDCGFRNARSTKL